MSNTYGTIITTLGEALIANAAANGVKLNITALIIGDGAGEYVTPSADMTDLVNQVWSGAVESVALNAQSPNVIDVHAILPSDVGGFTIRELALLDADGNIIAVGNTPEIEKTALGSGFNSELDVYVHIVTSHAASINITVNSNLYATREYVDTATTALIELSAAVTPSAGTRLHAMTVKDVSGYIPKQPPEEADPPDNVEDAYSGYVQDDNGDVYAGAVDTDGQVADMSVETE